METKLKKIPIMFPSINLPLDRVEIIFTSKNLGLISNVFIHEIARRLCLYNQPIRCDIRGRDDQNKKIAVNTVGRWLFGVPGYGGHLRVVPGNDNIMLHYPEKSPKVVRDLVLQIKQSVESAN